MQTNSGKRAAIYCRISETDAAVDKIANQVADCRAHATRRGYTVVDELVFTDDGISASKFAYRPQYEQLVEAAEAGKFEVLVATAEDRLSRQPLEKIKLAATCAERGILWDTVSDGVTDPSTDIGEFLSYFRGWTGRAEQREKAARLKRRFAKQLAEGKPLWGVRPFGFELDRIDHREDEAEELRWAYAQVLDGASLGSIMRAWNARGIKTTRGNAFSYATVRQVLRRPRNAGLMEKDGKIIEDVSVVWEPIVDRETWDKACALLSDPARRTTDNREPRWVCAGLVHCWCGAVLRSGSGSDRHSTFTIYRCAAPGASAGRHASIKTDDLDPLVRDAIVSTFMFAPTANLATTVADVETVRALEARRREIHQGKADLLGMVGQPGVTSADVTRPLAKLGVELNDVEERLEQHARNSAHAAMLVNAGAAMWSAPGKPVSLTDAAVLQNQLRERFESLPLEQQRTLVKSLLNVTVNPYKGGKSVDRVDIEHVGAPSINVGTSA